VKLKLGFFKEQGKMNKFKEFEKCDFILSFGTFFENNQELKNKVLKSTKNGTKFSYMFPIDNASLKPFYTQFIKYEVGSEEGICALLLDTFVKNCDEKTIEFIENLDLGYISAESSAGEEEFEEAKKSYENSNSKVLIIGEDIKNHERFENIIKILSLIKKYADFKFIILDESVEKSINSCSDFDLEEIEELKSFNGTLVYSLVGAETDFLLASQTFANIAKVKDGEHINIISKNETIKKVLKIDENITGTVAILNTKNEPNEYRYKQVKIEKIL
jgi:NADH-quinone oxidoreductase subunit F